MDFLFPIIIGIAMILYGNWGLKRSEKNLFLGAIWTIGWIFVIFSILGVFLD